MTQYLTIHPIHPQKRLIQQAVKMIQDGGLVVYPTDSCYALGCHLGDKDALERMRRLRAVDANHNFTLMCRDLSEIGTYSQVDNSMFRLLRSYTPGAFTFILKATREVPRRLQTPKRKTIGIRIPQNPIALALLAQLEQPLMSTTLILPGDPLPMTEADEIRACLGKQVDLIIDGGSCDIQPTTVIDLVDGRYEILRQGKGHFHQE
jgi:tRNA threonylcarbamoyl adenosine modification protein (Sua5/YciO/YrdC/YwlC family)